MSTINASKPRLLQVAASLQIAGSPVPFPLELIEIHQRLSVPTTLVASLDVSGARDSGRDRPDAQWLGQPFQLAFTAAGGAAAMYKGIVMRVRFSGRTSVLHLSSQTELMAHSRVTVGFARQTPDACIESILEPFRSKVKIDFHGSGKGGTWPYLLRRCETALDVIRRIAREQGYFVLDSGESLLIGHAANSLPLVTLSAASLPGGGPTIDLQVTHGCVAAQLHRHDPHETIAANWDGTRPPQAREAMGIEPDESRGVPAADRDGLHEVLVNRARAGGHPAASVTVTASDPHARVGSRIKLPASTTTAPGLSGPLLVVAAKVVWERGGTYRAQLTAVPPADAVIAPDPTPRSSDPGTLCVAARAVVIDNKDPSKLGRVEVRFSWDPQATLWARVGAVAAGASHGHCSTPVIGDEVLVICEDGDPLRAVVIAGLYHADAKPKVNGPEDVLLVHTPGGAEIRVSPVDGGEQIHLLLPDGKGELLLKGGSSPAIHLKTPGPLVMNAESIEMVAEKKITLDSGGSMTVKAASSMEVAGSTVKAKASGAMNLEGGIIHLN